MTTPATGFSGTVDTIGPDVAFGRHWTRCGFAEFGTMAESIGARVSCTYNLSGPSRMVYAYTATATYSLRVFDDGGMNWFEVGHAERM